MTLLKRQAPNALGALDRKQEWEAFIDFLKVLFNIADRVATLYIPVSEYLQFLDAVEDAVIDQMNNAFRKQAGPGYDETPLKVSIAAAFETAQTFYLSHRFMITDDSPDRDRYLKAFGEAVANTLGLKGNKMIVPRSKRSWNLLTSGVPPQPAPPKSGVRVHLFFAPFTSRLNVKR